MGTVTAALDVTTNITLKKSIILEFLKKWHFLAMFIMWCPLVDFAVTVASFFKYKWKWY